MSSTFSLGDRMKRYEAVWDTAMMRRSPAIVRVDGKAFHTLTRGMDKPFDNGFLDCMVDVADALVGQCQGAKIAYCQSDEVSVLLTDFDTITTEAWFAYRVQKLVSVAAAIATAAFTPSFRLLFPEKNNIPLFDARAFTLPKDEVTNYFVWRQRDAVRNSILSLAQSKFSAKEMHKKNTSELQEMLFQRHGLNWNDTPTHLKRGFCVTPDCHDWHIPEFTQDRDYIELHLPTEHP